MKLKDRCFEKKNYVWINPHIYGKSKNYDVKKLVQRRLLFKKEDKFERKKKVEKLIIIEG